MNEYQYNNLKQATKETPVYAKLKLYEKGEKIRTEKDLPYAEVMTAVTKVIGDNQESSWLEFVVLEVDELNEPSYMFMPQVGTYMMTAVDHVEGNTIPETVRYANEYNSVRQMHKDRSLIAHGALYEDEPSYHDWDTEHKHPYYEEIPETRFYWDLTNETLKSGCPVDSLWTAEMWVLEHHPDYLFGLSISGECPSGDFKLTPIPCDAYPEGLYENSKNRRKYEEQMAEKYGTKLGPKEYDMAVASARLVPEIKEPEEKEQDEPQSNEEMTL